jgi:hypothetical protein
LNSISWKYELKIKLNDLYYLVRKPKYSAEHKHSIYRIKFEFKRLVKRRKRNLKRQFQSKKLSRTSALANIFNNEYKSNYNAR